MKIYVTAVLVATPGCIVLALAALSDRGTRPHLWRCIDLYIYEMHHVRYHLDEDPKTLKVFPLPLKDAKGSTLHYDHMSISPDGKILAATCGSTLQWLCAETGKVLNSADKSHDGDITGIAWAPTSVPIGVGDAMILATSSADRKVKLWLAPGAH